MAQSVEDITRWNRDKERWDRLWQHARVRTAPIPKALSVCLHTLRLPQGERTVTPPCLCS